MLAKWKAETWSHNVPINRGLHMKPAMFLLAHIASNILESLDTTRM